MTKVQKEICKALFTGHFLRKTRNHNGSTMYKLFDAKGNPLQFYRVKTVEGIDKHEGFSLFKGNPREHMTLNLASVRRLHGKRWLKQRYKYHAKKKKHEEKKA